MTNSRLASTCFILPKISDYPTKFTVTEEAIKLFNKGKDEQGYIGILEFPEEKGSPAKIHLIPAFFADSEDMTDKEGGKFIVTDDHGKERSKIAVSSQKKGALVGDLHTKSAAMQALGHKAGINGMLMGFGVWKSLAGKTAGIKEIRNRSSSQNFFSIRYGELYTAFFKELLPEGHQTAHALNLPREIPLGILQDITQALCANLQIAPVSLKDVVPADIQSHFVAEDRWLADSLQCECALLARLIEKKEFSAILNLSDPEKFNVKAINENFKMNFSHIIKKINPKDDNLNQLFDRIRNDLKEIDSYSKEELWVLCMLAAKNDQPDLIDISLSLMIKNHYAQIEKLAFGEELSNDPFNNKSLFDKITSYHSSTARKFMRIALNMHEASKSETPNAAIVQAVTSNQIDTLKSLLSENKMDINFQIGLRLKTALHVALMLKNDEAIKELLLHGADIALATSDSKTPIMLATKYNKLHLFSDRLATLVDKTILNSRDDKGYTALMIAIKAKQPVSVDILLKNGAKVSEADLLLAAKVGDLDILKSILAKGIVPDFECLETALYAGKDQVAALLFEAGGFDSGMTLKGNDGCYEGWNLLMFAAQKGLNQFAQALLANGADPYQPQAINLIIETFFGDYSAAELTSTTANELVKPDNKALIEIFSHYQNKSSEAKECVTDTQSIFERLNSKPGSIPVEPVVTTIKTDTIALTTQDTSHNKKVEEGENDAVNRMRPSNKSSL